MSGSIALQLYNCVQTNDYHLIGIVTLKLLKKSTLQVQ